MTTKPIKELYNERIRANNSEFKFYIKGAARLWLELGGLLGE